jgi:multiple sugar transport system permease protein
MLTGVRRMLQRHWGWLYLLPSALLVLLVLGYPVASNIAISLTDKHLLQKTSHLVGAANYVTILSDADFYSALNITLVTTLGSVALQVFVGVAAAILLFYTPVLQGFFRTVLILPWMIPVIAIAIIWRWILNDLYGILPYYAVVTGLTHETVSVLSSPLGSLAMIIVIDVWRAYPLIMVSTLAGLQTIPRDHFEVATIEGASGYQTFARVILPSILPILGTMIILRTIWTLNDFARIYLLTGGGPGSSTETIPIYIYKMTWFSRMIGLGSAASVLVLVLLLVLVSVYLKTLRVERAEV